MKLATIRVLIKLRISEFFQNSKELFKRLISKEFIPYALLFIGALIIIIYTTHHFHLGNDHEFHVNILVESFGFLMDVLFLGILITIINSKKEKKQKIERYNEEIDDYRSWNEPEATYRIIGLIKRLAKLNATKIDLYFCNLSACVLENISIKNSDLSQAQFDDGAIINNTSIESCILWRTNFNTSELNHCSFESSELNRTFFNDANLTWISFKNTDTITETEFKNTNLIHVSFENSFLDNVSFEGAKFKHEVSFKNSILRKVNFNGAVGCSYIEFSKVKYIQECDGIPETIEKKLRKNKPELFILDTQP
jgi:hypothetical protein